ncbi:MAG: TetR/AcrR family transcriptional regulator [Pseudomonadales bacterium]
MPSSAAKNNALAKSNAKADSAPATSASNSQVHGRKGLEARAKLKRAAMTVLEERGYHAMRIADVTGEAGVATGLFYHYFSDLKTLTLEVLSDFVAQSRNLEEIERGLDRTDWFGRMLAHNRLVVNSYAERPGLMRCLLQMADEDPAFSAQLRENFVESLHWLVARMPKLFPQAEFTEHQALLLVYSVAGCGEMLLRDYFINHDAALHSKEVSIDELVELLSVTFYRGLFAQNPPAEKLKYTCYVRGMVLTD